MLLSDLEMALAEYYSAGISAVTSKLPSRPQTLSVVDKCNVYYMHAERNDHARRGKYGAGTLLHLLITEDAMQDGLSTQLRQVTP